MKRASYVVNKKDGVQCQLCPHFCFLKEGQTGICRTRKNIDGSVFSLAYGNPCAVHVDPIEKKPLNHFLPASLSLSISTAGCNLRCRNCQNWQISQKGPEEVPNFRLMPDEVVALAKKEDCQSIAYTYTDPIVYYEYTLDSAKLAREAGIKNVIVSAGYIEEAPLREWCQYIDAANIDLKSFSDELYRKLNGAALEPVLRTLKVLREEGVWLEITNLVVPGWTDDLAMIKKMCQWLSEEGFQDVPLHFSRFSPNHKLEEAEATPVEVLDQARQIAEESGLRYVYIGNVWGHPAEHTYCPFCQKKLIDRMGYRINENHIKDGKCEYCNNIVAGVWF
ncbi:AmmeMemoRadiSam system radical SAM enzyme [Marinilabiliaceae bacterium JC017]|nr:AmmeMemoRadiSam system radical SAM enzyme [Marinilabiliaceae bacterium JC017]